MSTAKSILRSKQDYYSQELELKEGDVSHLTPMEGYSSHIIYVVGLRELVVSEIVFSDDSFKIVTKTRKLLKGDISQLTFKTGKLIKITTDVDQPNDNTNLVQYFYYALISGKPTLVNFCRDRMPIITIDGIAVYKESEKSHKFFDVVEGGPLLPIEVPFEVKKVVNKYQFEGLICESEDHQFFTMKRIQNLKKHQKIQIFTEFPKGTISIDNIIGHFYKLIKEDKTISIFNTLNRSEIIIRFDSDTIKSITVLNDKVIAVKSKKSEFEMYSFSSDSENHLFKLEGLPEFTKLSVKSQTFLILISSSKQLYIYQLQKGDQPILIKKYEEFDKMSSFEDTHLAIKMKTNMMDLFIRDEDGKVQIYGPLPKGLKVINTRGRIFSMVSSQHSKIQIFRAERNGEVTLLSKGIKITGFECSKNNFCSLKVTGNKYYLFKINPETGLKLPGDYIPHDFVHAKGNGLLKSNLYLQDGMKSQIWYSGYKQHPQPFLEIKYNENIQKNHGYIIKSLLTPIGGVGNVRRQILIDVKNKNSPQVLENSLVPFRFYGDRYLLYQHTGIERFMVKDLFSKKDVLEFSNFYGTSNFEETFNTPFVIKKFSNTMFLGYENKIKIIRPKNHHKIYSLGDVILFQGNFYDSYLEQIEVKYLLPKRITSYFKNLRYIIFGTRDGSIRVCVKEGELLRSVMNIRVSKSAIKGIYQFREDKLLVWCEDGNIFSVDLVNMSGELIDFDIKGMSDVCYSSKNDIFGFIGDAGSTIKIIYGIGSSRYQNISIEGLEKVQVNGRIYKQIIIDEKRGFFLVCHNEGVVVCQINGQKVKIIHQITLKNIKMMKLEPNDGLLIISTAQGIEIMEWIDKGNVYSSKNRIKLVGVQDFDIIYQQKNGEIETKPLLVYLDGFENMMVSLI